MTTNHFLRALLQLNKSSPGFSGQLSDILENASFDESISNFPDDELTMVIEFLDDALYHLKPDSATFARTLRKLRRTCISRVLLPPSYILSSGKLDISQDPFSSGGFSDVYQGTYDGLRVCVKKLRTSSVADGLGETREMLLVEALTWKRLTHDNIVPFTGVTIDPPQIASEWMPWGDLTTYINSNPQEDRLTLLVDVANGLCFLHACHVIHGDLKGSNILVDGSGRARITDFGLARDDSGVSSVTGGHSTQWTAPELLEGELPSRKADVFSFGMVVIEVFTGTVPYDHLPPAKVILTIVRGERPQRPTHPTFTNELWELTQGCWDQVPHKRLEMPDVLQRLNASRVPPQIPKPVEGSKRFPGQSRRSNSGLLALSFIPDPLASISDIHRRLNRLNPSSDEYPQLLLEFLTHRKLTKYTCSLREEELREFAAFLDNALDHLSLTNNLFRRTLHKLQDVCDVSRVLPSSYFIPDERISDRGVQFWSGSFTDEHEAEWDGKKVCIKVMRLHSQNTAWFLEQEFYRAVVLWKRLQHPNLVPFLGVPANIPPFEVVYDWMENGRITEYLKRHPRTYRLGLLWDVAEGIHYLHSCKIIHGDLKAANVLVDKDGHARITDFGLTSIFRMGSPQDQSMTTTAPWPDMSKGGVLTKEGDIFAFAMVAVETFTGRPPFFASYPFAWYDMISGKRPQRPETLTNEGLWKLVQRCWKQDPGDRPTTSELLEFFRTSFPGDQQTKIYVLPGTLSTQSLPLWNQSTWYWTGSEAHQGETARPQSEGMGLPPRARSSVPFRKRVRFGNIFKRKTFPESGGVVRKWF